MYLRVTRPDHRDTSGRRPHTSGRRLDSRRQWTHIGPMTLHEGDVVRVTTPGEHYNRVGAIYDGIGIPNDPWTRTGATGEPEYRVYFDLELDAGWFTADQLRVVEAMPAARLAPGDRVRVSGAAHWTQGEMGEVQEGMGAIERQRSGPTRVCMVWFDNPRDDGSGDGPYVAGQFPEDQLELLESPSGPGGAEHVD